MMPDALLLDQRMFAVFAELVADTIIAKQEPVQDAITQRQAEDLYGRRWLRYHIEQGHITRHRSGKAKNSPVIYSRRELRSIYVAEQHASTQIKRKYERNKKSANNM